MIDVYPYFLMKDHKPYRYEFIIGQSCELITLAAGIFDDLNWEEGLKKCAAYKEAGKKVLIKLSLGLQSSFSPFSQSDFNSYSLAIDHLNKMVIGPYSDIIAGVILYEGSVCLERCCQLQADEISANIAEPWGDIYAPSMQARLVSASFLGMILHRLVAILDERVPAFALFNDAEQLSPLDRAIFFSKERFDHIFVICANRDFQYTTLDLGEGFSTLGYLAQKTQQVPELITLGVLLPQDATFSLKSYQKLEKLMETLALYRMIPETLFNECWNDLDKVIYDASSTNGMTRRMISGFVASGGEAIEI